MIDTCLDCKDFVHSNVKVVGKREVVKGVFEPVTEKIPHHCTKCNDVMLAWFEKYGDIPTSKLTKECQLPCLELREHLKCLDKAIALSQKIIDKLPTVDDEHSGGLDLNTGLGIDH